MWLDSAPDVAFLNFQEEGDRDEMVIYFDENVVWGCVMIQQLPPAVVSPPSIDLPVDLSDEGMERDLTELINRVQHHTCGSYCLRKKKTPHSDRDDGDDIPDGAPAEDHPMECRFGFPQPEQPFTDILEDPKRGWVLRVQRSVMDGLTNQFNPHYLQIWQANTDFTPITSLRAVLLYIVKYAVKLETASVSLSHVLQTFAGKIKADKPARSALIKLMMTYPIEHDFSCQEAAHIILGLPLIEKSFKVVSINLSSLSQVMLNTEALDDDSDDSSRATYTDTLIKRYMNHGSQFEDISLYDILESYEYKLAKNDWQ